MKYEEWMEGVMPEIKRDPIWSLEVYRLALIADDIGWQDVLALSKEKLMWSIADQLHRSLGSIRANLAEGYSRSKAPDRARFIEMALGSARECRDWYYKSRHVLRDEIINHRIGLLSHIIGMLTLLIKGQRQHAIRESPPDYGGLLFSTDAVVLLP